MQKQPEYAGSAEKERLNIISKTLQLWESRNPEKLDSGMFVLDYPSKEKIRSKKLLDLNHLAAMNE